MAVSSFARCSDPRDIPTIKPGRNAGLFLVKMRQSKNLVQTQIFWLQHAPTYASRVSH
jgi:hypothetical protein